jgi:hypothetical protein
MESSNKKWTPPETRNLISVFEESPCLWNIFNKDYKNKDMKARALTKISLSLCFSVYEVKRKLHNFRCQCTSELKKTRVKKSGQGASGRCRSVAAVNTRETTGNLLLHPGETAGS